MKNANKAEASREAKALSVVINRDDQPGQPPCWPWKNKSLMLDGPTSQHRGIFRGFWGSASRYLDHHFSSEDRLISHLFFWTRLV